MRKPPGVACRVDSPLLGMIDRRHDPFPFMRRMGGGIKTILKFVEEGK